MTKEEIRKVELTLLDFICRAAEADAPRVEVEALPRVAMALAEISKVKPSDESNEGQGLAYALERLKILSADLDESESDRSEVMTFDEKLELAKEISRLLAEKQLTPEDIEDVCAYAGRIAPAIIRNESFAWLPKIGWHRIENRGENNERLERSPEGRSGPENDKYCQVSKKGRDIATAVR